MSDAPINALVLDDDPGSRWVVKMVLADLPEVVAFEADSVADAVRVIEEHPIHVALLDVYLPDGKGHEVLQHLQTQSPDVVCVVASAHPNLSDAVEAMRGKAQDYIHKPYLEREQLKQAMQRAVHTFRLRRKNRALNEALNATVADLRKSNATLEETRNSLVERERQASMGRLALGLMHHINNPLAGMMSNLHFVTKYTLPVLDGDEGTLADLADCLGEMTESVTRVMELATALRVVFDSAAPAPVDVEGLVRTALARVRAEGSGDLHEALDMERRIRVKGDAARLSRILSNVVANAVQANKGSGEIAIRAWRDGDNAVIEVHDDGPGMAPEVRDRATEPFFTTRSVNGGLGLGLAAAQGVVIEHGGNLSIESGPDLGTTVRIRLPRILTIPDPGEPPDDESSSA